MDASNSPTNYSRVAKKQFWQEHIKLKQESYLSRAQYCRRHELSVSQFGYWEQKCVSQVFHPASELLPVMLNPGNKITTSEFLGTSCSVVFKNGHELKVHDQAILPLLISLLS